jgi:hypothetical protein
LFIDSGLAAYNPEQGQPHLLASDTRLSRWGAVPTAAGRFVEVPAILTLGPVSGGALTAFAVTDRLWRDGFLSAWSGVQLEALVSHGFLKQ